MVVSHGVVAVPDGRVDDSITRLEQRGPVPLREVGVRVEQRGGRRHRMPVKLALGWRLGCDLPVNLAAVALLLAAAVLHHHDGPRRHHWPQRARQLCRRTRRLP